MPTTTINLTGQALSKTDDTNVTLTLGGTPSTALLKATSLTLGWSGTLADARITSAATWNAKESALTFGTGLTRTVNTVTIDSTVVTLTGAQALSNKTGLISQWTNDSGYLTSLSGAVTNVTGSGNIASSGGTTPNITFTGVLPTANGGTGVNIATTALTLGTASSAAGSIVFQNATNANTVTMVSGVTSASYSVTLPTAQGGANTYLKNDGAGVLSWATVASGITIGDAISGSTANRVLYAGATNLLAQKANFTMDSVATGYLDVPSGYGIAGHALIKEVNTTSIVIGNTSGVSMTGAGNTVLGYQNGIITNGTNNTYIGATATTRANNNGASYNTTLGYGIDINSTTGYNVVVGALSGLAVTGYYNVIMGVVAGTSGLSGTGNIILGCYAGENSTAATSSNILIGANSFSTTSNTAVIGGANSHGVDGTISNIYLNNPTSTAPTSVTIHASGGSGTNIASANMSFSTKATGNAASGYFSFLTGTAGASGTTLQTAAERFRITGTGLLYATSIHNNASANGSATQQDIRSGTYTPTLTNVTNISASTAYVCQWMRVGNVVTVSGKYDMTPTGVGLCELGMSLPVASNFANDYECAGTSNGDSGTSNDDAAWVIADTTNDRASHKSRADGGFGAHSHWFTFTYVVI